MLYLFWWKKGAPFTDNRESFFFDRAMPTTAFSFLLSLSPPFSKVKGWLLSVLKKSLVTARKLFLIPDSALPCLLWVPLVCVGLLLKQTHGGRNSRAILWISASGVKLGHDSHSAPIKDFTKTFSRFHQRGLQVLSQDAPRVGSNYRNMQNSATD